MSVQFSDLFDSEEQAVRAYISLERRYLKLHAVEMANRTGGPEKTIYPEWFSDKPANPPIHRTEGR